MPRTPLAHWRIGALLFTLAGLSIGAIPVAHAQPGVGLFANDGGGEDRQPRGERGHRDWRNTLGGHDRYSESGAQRRKMSEEERNNLREHLRDAARGAYPEQSPQRKGKR